MRKPPQDNDPEAPKRSLRRQITLIVLIPSVSFLLLWSIMSITTTLDAVSLTTSALEGRDSSAGFESFGAELRNERRSSQIYLADPSDGHRNALEADRASTDEVLSQVREQAVTLIERGEGEKQRRARDLFDGLAELERMRGAVDNGSTDRAESLADYTDLLAVVHRMFDATSRGLADHRGLAQGLLALELLRARDQYSQADALLAGTIAAEAMTYEETAHFIYLTASYRDRLRESREQMPEVTLERYEEMVGGGAWRDVEELSRTVVVSAPAAAAESGTAADADWSREPPVTAEEWDEANAVLSPQFHELAVGQATVTIESAWSSALRLIGLNLGGSLLALSAGAVAILAASRSARTLIRRLRHLRIQTLELAEERLPKLVSRAQRGERVDLSTEMPKLRYGEDELGAVADAFNTAQRTAVGAAIKQAEISEGASRVFQSIAYRNQTLIQRQLSLLDEMENEERDPETLRKLFRLDHFATRGRRYADNLIILGGAGCARRWRYSLPLADVLRAAISETENFERVRLRCAPKILVRGIAAADVVHLLAELVENATQFSPADAGVDVSGGGVSRGVMIEIEDRGLGMSEEAYAAANRTLARTPEYDIMAMSEEPRLGLFVVARLAARHGIRVRLCPSPYGGTRAVALLPEELLEPMDTERGRAPEPSEEAREAELALPSASAAPRTEGRSGD